jgi:hypothetical protein
MVEEVDHLVSPQMNTLKKKKAKDQRINGLVIITIIVTIITNIDPTSRRKEITHSSSHQNSMESSTMRN